MAFHDWNGDGKKDWKDNLIEYQVYKDVTSDSDDEDYEDNDYDTDYSFSSYKKTSNTSNSSNFFDSPINKFLIIALVVLWAIYILTSCQEIFH